MREKNTFQFASYGIYKPLTHGYGYRGWRFAGKGRAFPSPEAGEVGRGQMHLRYLISTV